MRSCILEHTQDICDCSVAFVLPNKSDVFEHKNERSIILILSSDLVDSIRPLPFPARNGTGMTAIDDVLYRSTLLRNSVMIHPTPTPSPPSHRRSSRSNWWARRHMTTSPRIRLPAPPPMSSMGPPMFSGRSSRTISLAFCRTRVSVEAT